LAITDVPSIRLTHLTELQKRAYIIADNKLALNSGWDDEMLAVELTDLKDMGFDLDLTGFSSDEIDDLLTPINNEIESSPQLTDGFKFSVIIACADEIEQGQMLEKFELEGHKCRPLITQ